jgi:mannose-6-phosphate isomerase-like protein (cupin superfamily)
MANAYRFSFGDCKFERTIDHGGRGEIAFSRVRDTRPDSGCNWLDLSVLPPRSSIGVHTHDPDDEEIYVVISGRGRMTVGEESFVVGPGDVIVNPPAGTHGLENIGDTDLRLVVVDIGCPRPS